MNDLLLSIDKLHTTELGESRIRKNLSLGDEDVTEWCRRFILDPGALFEKRGKNWYVSLNGRVLTVNSRSYTLITAHEIE